MYNALKKFVKKNSTLSNTVNARDFSLVFKMCLRPITAQGGGYTVRTNTFLFGSFFPAKSNFYVETFREQIFVSPTM